MAQGRSLKASTWQFWSSVLLGSAISYFGLYKLKPSNKENTCQEKGYPSNDLDILYDYRYSLWKRFQDLNVYWINLLDDISMAQLQEKMTKQISKALSHQWACESGLTHKVLKVLQEHSTRRSRILLTNVIASLDITAERDREEILSSCDERLLIGLARLLAINTTILETFNDMNFKLDNKISLTGPMENHLKALLLSLPLYGMDSCTKWFTKSAFLTGTSSIKHKRSLSWSFGGDSSLSFAHNFTSMPSDQVELYYLKALTRHTMVSSHSQVMVENGVLPILHQELRQRRNNLRITQEIAHIIGNLALDPVTHNDIVHHGFLPVLRTWLLSEDLTLSTHAGRALANLDHDWNDPEECYEEGVYVLHPDKRQSGDVAADIVFVHGLRGGPLKTWRIEGTKTLLTGEQCWPKAWLAKDFPNVRVIVVEYDSYFSNWASQCPTQPETRSLAFRSEQIMMRLKQAGVGKRPVIWITHSMGGLLVKQLLLHAQDDKKHRVACKTAVASCSR